jgi:hypothetical protein
MDYWRRACEVSRAQRVRNDKIRRTEVGGLIVETIKWKRLYDTLVADGEKCMAKEVV